MNDPDMTNRELSEQIGDLRKDVDRRFETVEKKVNRIDTALYGTGNPHGGLFQQFAVLDGKVSTLSSEIKGVEKTLIAKIEGVEEKFDKMFSFAKWIFATLIFPIWAASLTVLIKILWPTIQKWMGV